MNNIASTETGERNGAIEANIKAAGLTALRITRADVRANIAQTHYFTVADGVDGRTLAISRALEPEKSVSYRPLKDDPDVLETGVAPLSNHMFCVLVLRNGFAITGEAICVDTERFDAEIGKKIARANAINKVWPLMGYQLKEQLYQRTQPTQAPT